jgi:hypothetical protein
MQKLNGCPNYEDRLRQYEDLVFEGQANEYFDLIVDLEQLYGLLTDINASLPNIGNRFLGVSKCSKHQSRS